MPTQEILDRYKKIRNREPRFRHHVRCATMNVKYAWGGAGGHADSADPAIAMKKHSLHSLFCVEPTLEVVGMTNITERRLK